MQKFPPKHVMILSKILIIMNFLPKKQGISNRMLAFNCLRSNFCRISNTGSILFFIFKKKIPTIYFPCLLLYTWDTLTEEGATAPSLKRENPLLGLLGGSWATGHRKVESLKSTQIKQSQSNIVQRAAWWLCLCSRVQNKEEGQSWKQRSKQSQQSHVRSGVKKFSWQEIVGNCTLIVCNKRHSIPWAIELKFVFDLEKQVVIPFHSTIASSFWATTTLASSKNVTSKYPCVNKMTNLKDLCICSCMQSLISLWHGKQQMHLAMTICWSCFSSAFLLNWTHSQDKLCATSHA